MIEAVDGEGKASRREYGPFDTLERIIDPKGGVIAFEHDRLMRLTRVSNELGEHYRYHYDGADNVVKEQDFSGRVLRYAYDGAGNLKQKIAGNGTKTVYEYDIMDRLLCARSHVSKGEGETEKVEETRFGYNEAGELESAVNKDAQILFERDDLGRVTGEHINGARFYPDTMP